MEFRSRCCFCVRHEKCTDKLSMRQQSIYCFKNARNALSRKHCRLSNMYVTKVMHDIGIGCLCIYQRKTVQATCSMLKKKTFIGQNFTYKKLRSIEILSSSAMVNQINMDFLCHRHASGKNYMLQLPPNLMFTMKD